MKVKVFNLPNYPLKKWIVARYDSNTKKLWFYGTWDEKTEAERVAAEIDNGVVVEND